MSAIEQQKGKLRNIFFEGSWSDTLWSLAINRRGWIKLASVFLLIWIPITYLFQDYNHLFANRDQESGLFGSYADNEFSQLFDTAICLFIGWVQTYFFIILFLNQQPTPNLIKPSLKNFVYSSGQLFLMVLIVGVPLILNALIWHMLIKYGPVSFTDSETAKLAQLILETAAIFFIYATSAYLVARCFLIMPLAIGNMHSPVAFSWRLTRRKFLRIAVNVLILELLINAPFWTIKMFLRPISEVSTKGLLANLSLSIIYSIYVVLESGVLSAFICVAYRKFYQEDIISRIGADRRAVPRF